MTPSALVVGMLVVIGQTLLLFWLSRRLLLGYVLRTLASRSSSARGRRLVSLLRLPGNLLHEISHAAAYLISGYRIQRLATCWSDPEGRGYVETGRPWSPLHWAPLAAALSCAAPIVVGALAIHALGSALGVPLPAMDVTSEGVRPVAARTLTDVWFLVSHLDWAAWQTYVFWLLAFSIGAELAPSGADLRQGFVMLCVLVLLSAVGILAVPEMELRPERAEAVLDGAQWLLSALSTALFAGLIGCGLAGLVAGAFTWVLRRSARPTQARGKSRPPSPKSPRRSDRRAGASYRRSRRGPPR
ncbi:MAG: hypothetical protein FJX75_03795 [Armatimonadetes bacterium]|nr:hypothetical protein [Armatimonadota bacterium]